MTDLDVPLDPSAPEPIYAQIRAGIAAAISRGDLEPGQPLPSIRVLARDLRVSVITTTRAYHELVADGLVDAVRGKGVFVRAQDPAALRERALPRIDEALAQAVSAARAARMGAAELHARLDLALDPPKDDR